LRLHWNSHLDLDQFGSQCPLCGENPGTFSSTEERKTWTSWTWTWGWVNYQQKFFFVVFFFKWTTPLITIYNVVKATCECTWVNWNRHYCTLCMALKTFTWNWIWTACLFPKFWKSTVNRISNHIQMWFGSGLYDFFLSFSFSSDNKQLNEFDLYCMPRNQIVAAY